MCTCIESQVCFGYESHQAVRQDWRVQGSGLFLVQRWLCGCDWLASADLQNATLQTHTPALLRASEGKKRGGNMGQRSELARGEVCARIHDLNEAFQFTYQNLREDKEFVLEAG